MHVTQWLQAGHREGGIMSTQTTTLQGGVSENAVILTDNNIGHWFSTIVEDTLNLQSQITDNYIENNTAIQDHIAISPLTVTLRGYVGEVEFRPPVSFSNFLVTGKYDEYASTDKYDPVIAEKLSPLSALLPPVDNVTKMAKNAAQYVETSFNRYKRIYKQLNSLGKKGQKQATESVQQYTAQRLKEMWENRTLVEVISPYGFYENMAIQSISFIQGNTTTQSELSVTLKQINYATTRTTKPNDKVMAIYNACQRTEEANHGKAQGVEVNRDSILSKWMLPSDVPVSNYKKK